MKITTSLLFLLLPIICYNQTIQELEKELRFFKNGESRDKIEIARKLFKLDDYNQLAIHYILRDYDEKHIDSAKFFLDRLVATHENDHKAHILRSKYAYAERDTANLTSNRIRYLNDALKIDPNNSEAIYKLAEIHYRDFICPKEKMNHDLEWRTGDFEKDSIKAAEYVSIFGNLKCKSVIPNSPDLALSYFKKLWAVDSACDAQIYFPIQQLGCYLKKDVSSFELPDSNRYFNENEFTQLKTDWRCDTSIDYLFEIEISIGEGNYIQNQLEALKEPNLRKYDLGKNSEIYRFTWLRTFHHPIAVRIEDIGDKKMIYWKIGKGAGGYKPKGLKNEGKRRISKSQWKTFEKLIGREDYINIRNKQTMVIGDGAVWVMEHKYSKDSPSVKHTQRPDTDLYRSCMYLLKLAKIAIDENEIY